MEALRSRERLQPKPLGALDPTLRGDVEAVVMKALAESAQQRYRSAALMAEDLQQLLVDQPVSARAPTGWETASRLIRRHRAAFATAALIAVALLTATLVSWRSAQAEASARAEAEARTEVAESVSDFLNELLSSADPKRGKGADLSVRELLDSAVATLNRSQPKSAEVGLALRELLGNAYRNLGKYDQANSQWQQVRALRSARYGEQSTQVLETDVELAIIMINSGELAQATELLQRYSDRPGIADELLVRIQTQLAVATRIAGDPTEAAEILRRTLPLAQSLPAEPPQPRWRFQQSLAIVEIQLGEFERARELLEVLIAEKSARLGPGHADVLANRGNLATALDELGRWQEAAAVMRDVHAQEVAIYGPDNLLPISTLQNLAKILIERGEYAEAAPMLAQVGTVVERELGADHPQMLYVRNSRAALYEDTGDLVAAEDEYRKLLDSHARVNGAGAPEALVVRNNLAGLLRKLERMDEALEMYVGALDDAGSSLGEEHFLCAIIGNNYADALVSAGRAEEALPLLRDSLQVLIDNLGDDHERVLKAKRRLAAGEQALGSH